jgi:hypothetical protein
LTVNPHRASRVPPLRRTRVSRPGCRVCDRFAGSVRHAGVGTPLRIRPDEVLQRFDFVVASVHNGFKLASSALSARAHVSQVRVRWPTEIAPAHAVRLSKSREQRPSADCADAPSSSRGRLVAPASRPDGRLLVHHELLQTPGVLMIAAGKCGRVPSGIVLADGGTRLPDDRAL